MMAADKDPVIAKLEDEMRNPLPTADIGDIVIWYDRNIKSEENARPAVVLEREGPGKLKLKVLITGMDKHRTGVHYHEHPVHAIRNNHATVHNGSWAYKRGFKIPGFHYQLHKDLLERRKQAVLDEQRRQEEAKEARLKAEQAASAARTV